MTCPLLVQRQRKGRMVQVDARDRCCSWDERRLAKGGPGCSREITHNPCTATPEWIEEQVRRTLDAA